MAFKDDLEFSFYLQANVFVFFFFRARQLASLDKFFFRSRRELLRGLDGSITVNIIKLCHYQRNQTEINSTLSNRSINYDFNSLEKDLSRNWPFHLRRVTSQWWWTKHCRAVHGLPQWTAQKWNILKNNIRMSNVQSCKLLYLAYFLAAWPQATILIN